MKKYILFSTFFLVCLFAKAQDTIVKINGEKILAKITEITPIEVKYKKFDFQDGPLYIENKSNVQLIKYANGLTEHFQHDQSQNSNNEKNAGIEDYYGKPEMTSGDKKGKINISRGKFVQNNTIITEKQFYEVLKQTKDNELFALADISRRAKRRQNISLGFMIGGVVLLAHPVILLIYEPLPLILYCKNRTLRNNTNKKAVELYNKKF